MKRFLLLVALTLVCACKASDAGFYPKPEGALRIVQYNVGVFSKEMEDSKAMVAAMMRELGADALSLNELDSCNRRHGSFQLKEFVDEMNASEDRLWHGRFARAMAWNGGAYGVGAAVAAPVLDAFSIALPKGDGSEPRACAVLETADYVIASTHLDFKSKDAAAAQAALINELMTGRYEGAPKPVFLCGDMNAEADSQVLDELRKCWTVLSVASPTYSALNPVKCIDYILLLNCAAPVRLLGSAAAVRFTGADPASASDHLPVFVDVELK